MKKWSAIIILLFILSWSLEKARVFKGVARHVASVTSSSDCFNTITYFRNDDYSKINYQQYLDNFISLRPIHKNDFESGEEYLAWIEYQTQKLNVSFVDFIATKSPVSKRISEFITSNSRPDKSLAFIFSPKLERMILKDLPISELTRGSEKYLHRAIREKIAIDLFNSIKGKDTKFSKLMSSKYMQRVMDLFAYSPLFFGMPPIVIPKIMMERKTALMHAKSMDEINLIFSNMKMRDKSKMKALYYYDILRDHYIKFISTFYLGYTFYNIYTIEEEFESTEIIDSQLDESIAELEGLVNPKSCSVLYQCIEEYRESWEGKSEKAYIDMKASCRLVYDIDLKCD